MALPQPKLGLKDAFTLASVAAGTASISMSIVKQFPAAAALIGAAAALDYADGFVARMQNQHNEFGKQLDSLADAVSFGAAPAALALSAHNSLPVLAAAIAFACAGVYRLARFNLQIEKGVYYGLPIPASALVAVAVGLFAKDFLAAALVVLAGAMVSGFRIKKI